MCAVKTKHALFVCESIINSHINRACLYEYILLFTYDNILSTFYDVTHTPMKYSIVENPDSNISLYL